MKTELQTITPAIARDLLERNTDNRPLRPGVVDGFHAAYARGEWKLTHQGIAFGKTGRLLDGQHRLTFISRLPEGSAIEMYVTRDQDESTFDAIDQGFRRTPSDVLGVAAGAASVGRFFARILAGKGDRNISVQYLAPFVEWVMPEYIDLVSFCPGNARLWSSSPVRAAAIYQMKRGQDADFIKIAYHGLVSADVDAMPHAARLLVQQQISGKIVSARTNDLFCRAVRAFGAQHEKISRLIIKDQSAIVDEVRNFIIGEMKRQPKKTTGPKPVTYIKAQRAA